MNQGRVVRQRLVLVFSSALFLNGSLAFAQHDPGVRGGIQNSGADSNSRAFRFLIRR